MSASNSEARKRHDEAVMKTKCFTPELCDIDTDATGHLSCQTCRKSAES